MTGSIARIRTVTAVMGLVSVGWFLTGRAAQPAPEGLPTDWSHRHVIFSQPANAEQAERVAHDPRYWQQWVRQNVVRVLLDENQDSMAPAFPRALHWAGGQKVDADWSEDIGNGANTGAGIFPAKYAFQTTNATCGNAVTPDYVVFTTGVNGSSSQPSVVGFDNLYSGCISFGGVPSVYWAYNTGGQILTSPVISQDGKQVAFVQTNAALEGTLVLLKWAASSGTLSAPITLTPVATTAYRSCTAPCMTTIMLKNSSAVDVDDKTSSPFPDYGHDTLWVGGAVGWLHKITGAFQGTPAEATTGGFPVQVNPTNQNSLSSPAYDATSKFVFVGDYGGFLYRVSSTGAVTISAQVDHGTGIVSAPIVDTTSGKVYVFSSNDNGTSCSGGPCAAVYQFTVNFPGGSPGVEATVGASALSPNPIYDGTFDANYLASANATGNIYVCGNTGGPPVIYQVPVAAGVMKTPVAGPVLSNATTGCSPVTDVSNPNATGGATEWFFVSTRTQGLGNSCGTGGCAMNFKDQQWEASTSYVVGQQVLDSNFDVETVRTGGTSGAAAPAWKTVGVLTNDGTMKWVNQGPQSAGHAQWAAAHSYAMNAEIIDSNNNIQIVIQAGTSRGGTHPGWSTTVYATTTDGTVKWREVGAVATASIAAAGGTSGIIIDNTASSGTMAGASQVYFSTQSNQICTTSGGTGGCAIQASQSALQ